MTVVGERVGSNAGKRKGPTAFALGPFGYDFNEAGSAASEYTTKKLDT